MMQTDQQSQLFAFIAEAPDVLSIRSEVEPETKRRPVPPKGFKLFKWKGQLCPNCKKFDGYCSNGRLKGGWQDKTAMALSRHSDRKDLGCSKPDGWSNMIVLIDGGYLRDHWSRFGMMECMGCHAEIWHDFNDAGWNYYYKPVTLSGQNKLEVMPNVQP